MDPVKVAGVAEWPQPKNKREVQSFLGFANFYHRFIKDFSHHARPLFDLTRNDQKWKWDTSEATAFRKLKESIVRGHSLPTFRLFQLFQHSNPNHQPSSAVLLIERTAEAQPPLSQPSPNFQHCRKTLPHVPFNLYLLLNYYFHYGVIPSHHLSSYSHGATFILIHYFIVRL
jgi:hypothetical protein